MSILKNHFFQWCESIFPEHLALLKSLAVIPAPSHHEEQRAVFIKHWLETNGAAQVTIDEAKNVVLPLGWTGEPGLCVMAHTDIVFPDTSALPMVEEDGRLCIPGVGDDTANVVALMLCAKFFLIHPELLPEPLLIVFNSCEEGLGNLKGVRQIMTDYSHVIRALISFDCQSNSVISRAVGSERWQVNVTTPGGHSFSNFGSPNAISHLSSLITKLYAQNIPQKDNSQTTYNVGLISGGTSVNTIAQDAQMTYEYRSNDRDCLSVMRHQFEQLIAEANQQDVTVAVTSLGIRPCGEKIPADAHNVLLNRCKAAIQSVYKDEIPFCAASTDANIPLSLGIPAATFGLYRGDGAHTREEYVQIDSLTPGLKIALSFFLMNDTNC